MFATSYFWRNMLNFQQNVIYLQKILLFFSSVNNVLPALLVGNSCCLHSRMETNGKRKSLIYFIGCREERSAPILKYYIFVLRLLELMLIFCFNEEDAKIKDWKFEYCAHAIRLLINFALNCLPRYTMEIQSNFYKLNHHYPKKKLQLIETSSKRSKTWYNFSPRCCCCASNL